MDSEAQYDIVSVALFQSACYFKLAKCQIEGCDQRLVLTGSSTTTLFNHLQYQHEAVHDIVKAKIDKSTHFQPAITSSCVGAKSDDYLLKWLVKSYMPLSVVTDKNFKRFVASVNPKAKIASQHEICSLLRNKVQVARKKLKEMLKNEK